MVMMVIMVVMVLALTPPVDAAIRTECPAYNQSSMVPQQPLEMNKIGEGVLETRLQDYVGRVLTPWNITPSHNTISIILKITKWWMKVHKEEKGNQQSLAADQQCPRGVVGFPYKKLRVLCFDGDYCGQVLSPPTITEYTNISS
ncbi:hypothetical protein Pcinc_015212, partial [Petrolisthes cinctipes]